MIEKLHLEEFELYNTDQKTRNLSLKINELVDAVNELQEEMDLVGEDLEEALKVNKTDQNPNFKQPEVKEKADHYAEQKKWIGKLCKFWDYDDESYIYEILIDIEDDRSDYPYTTLDVDSKDWKMSYKHCEPVKPDDSIIYKGE